MTGTSETNIVEKVKQFNLIGWISKIPRRTIIDIIIILIPIFLIYIFVNRTPPEVKQTLQENKLIDKKVDSLKMDNQFIVARMFEYEKNQKMFIDMINENNDLVRKNNNELQKLKKIYNEKISSVNGYNISQLDSFFTVRYHDYYNK